MTVALVSDSFQPALAGSASMDVRGDGRQKASVFYGRYYDPVRLDMTNFAGTSTGQVREEQVFVNDQWVTYRVRGGPSAHDAVFGGCV